MSRFLKKEERKQERGITLIALITTIIVLLILAGITIGAITGSNGIIGQAQSAKEETEISQEKEIIDISTVEAMGKNNRGNLEEEEFQNAIDNHTNGKATVSDIGEEFEVFFEESNRYYTIDKDGNIIDYVDIVTDNSPGDITKDENGKELAGTEDEPYEIWCVEDLVVFSNMVNGEGIIIENGKAVEINTSTDFANKTVELKTNLNFKSKYSYVDSERTDFGDINGDENDGNTLMNEMLTGTGFNPIGNIELGPSFKGIFDGNENNIDNIYINRENFAGLFGYVSGAKEIRNINISGEINATNGYAGGIVAIYSKVNSPVDTNIINCINKSTISANGGNNLGDSYDGVAGGILGVTLNSGNLTIDNCHNLGEINGEMVSGGIIGRNGYYIINCSNSGIITSSGENSNTSLAGGIAGGIATSDIYIENSYNTGNIITKKLAGGIVGGGYAGKCTLKNVYNIGNIENATNPRVMIGNTLLTATITNGYYNSSLIDSNITVDNGLIDVSNKSIQEFVNLLNSYQDDDNTYPSNWKKWKSGDNGFPSFAEN